MSSDIDQPFQPTDLDFDALYRGQPYRDASGEAAFEGIPWDIGKAQPAVVALEAAGRFSGEVLDVGCGLGDNSIFLARSGYRVTGIDAAPTAIERAREHARAEGVEVEFAVTDATALAGYADRFDSVLDCALYHCLDEEGRRGYVTALHRATRPGARLSMLDFADVPLEGIPAPFAVPEANIRTTLDAAGWAVTDLTLGSLLAAVNSMGDFLDQLDHEVTPNADGHIALPVWIVQADRA